MSPDQRAFDSIFRVAGLYIVSNMNKKYMSAYTTYVSAYSSESTDELNVYLNTRGVQ